MCASYGAALHLDPKCRVLQFASYNFDVAVVDIIDTLVHGACLCIPSEHDRTNNIVNVMNKMGVTWADLTPSFASTFLPADVPMLQTLILAGEEVQQGHIERWAGKVRLINCYGPAESSACTSYEYTDPSEQPGMIGRPMNHANCWVIDIESPDQLAAPDLIGELVVESRALARGYLNNPEKTRAAFIQDPEWLGAYGSGHSRRVYRTGDLVRYRSDGSLKFVGRKDLQVKIRGQRVELGEVEHLLSTYPGIAKCMIAYPSCGDFMHRLVAVVRIGGSPSSIEDNDLQSLSHENIQRTSFDTEEVTRYLRRTLPSYMVPTDWVAIRSIPLTSSKKMDRRRVEAWLEDLSQSATLNSTGSSGPVDLLELSPDEGDALKMSTAVADLVVKGEGRREALHGHDFALSAVGVDSIQVISLSRYIEREYQVKIGVEILTKHDTTIRSLAAMIAASKSQPMGTTTTAIDLTKEVDTLYETQVVNKIQQSNQSSSMSHPVQTVFLTGATGFLGTQILRHLLLQPFIQSVILHVRADNAESGLHRIITTAKAAKWWSESFIPKIEIWLGDLTKPFLGLMSEQWRRLTLSASPDERVDAIVHNGGVVRWNADYSTLKPANALSTVGLLRAVSECHFPARFIYISGGQKLSFREEDDEKLIDQAAHSNGYAQSKIVSEILVKKFASDTKYYYHISVIKPSYIIGTINDGLANPNDYLWRLIAGAIEIEAYNADEADRWLFVSDAKNVARKVVESMVTSSAYPCLVTRILDGIPLRDVWHILATDFGYTLQPLGANDWWRRLRSHVEEKGESHFLWPLSYMLEEGKGDIGSEETAVSEATRSPEASERIEKAFRRNVEYLREVGFFPVKTTEVSRPD